jgi:hypothetical protein
MAAAEGSVELTPVETALFNVDIFTEIALYSPPDKLRQLCNTSSAIKQICDTNPNFQRRYMAKYPRGFALRLNTSFMDPEDIWNNVATFINDMKQNHQFEGENAWGEFEYQDLTRERQALRWARLSPMSQPDEDEWDVTFKMRPIAGDRGIVALIVSIFIPSKRGPENEKSTGFELYYNFNITQQGLLSDSDYQHDGRDIPTTDWIRSQGDTVELTEARITGYPTNYFEEMGYDWTPAQISIFWERPGPAPRWYKDQPLIIYDPQRRHREFPTDDNPRPVKRSKQEIAAALHMTRGDVHAAARLLLKKN